jgi:hypothetical protein
MSLNRTGWLALLIELLSRLLLIKRKETGDESED